jgi:hypothetical protein
VFGPENNASKLLNNMGAQGFADINNGNAYANDFYKGNTTKYPNGTIITPNIPMPDQGLAELIYHEAGHLQQSSGNYWPMDNMWESPYAKSVPNPTPLGFYDWMSSNQTGQNYRNTTLNTMNSNTGGSRPLPVISIPPAYPIIVSKNSTLDNPFGL